MGTKALANLLELYDGTVTLLAMCCGALMGFYSSMIHVHFADHAGP